MHTCSQIIMVYDILSFPKVGIIYNVNVISPNHHVLGSEQVLYISVVQSTACVTETRRSFLSCLP